jgi:hypothetical protein
MGASGGPRIAAELKKERMGVNASETDLLQKAN